MFTADQLDQIDKLKKNIQEAIYYREQLRSYVSAPSAGKPSPAAEPETEKVAAPDPKVVKAAWDAALATEKSAMEAGQAQRDAAVKDLSQTEASALQAQLKDQLAYNALEQRAAEAELTSTVAARKKAEADFDKQKVAEATAQQIELSAKLTELQSAEDKIRAEAAAKGFALTQKQAEFDAQQQIKLAEDTGNKTLAITLRFAEERRKAQETLGRPLTAAEYSAFDIGESYAKNVAQFDQALKDTNATVATYQQKINDTNQALAAHSVDVGTARAAIASYEQSIHTAVDGALPELTRLLNAIKEIGKLHPELKIDTTALEASLAKLQEAENRTPVRIQTQLQQLTSGWKDLGAQIDHTAAQSLQQFSDTSSKALLGTLEHTGHAREEFRALANEVIEGILRMLIQQTIAHTIGLAQSQATATQQTATNAQIAASAAPAAAMQSAASYGANTIGVGIMIAVVAAAIGLLLAMRKAEGGPVYGAGSTTSDSIPAMLSNKEYVHTAAAHEHLGTARMDMINQRRISPEAFDLAASVSRHALGGVVASRASVAAVPAFAAGGVVVRLAGGGAVPDVSVAAPIVMLGIGKDEIERLMATSDMQQALLDHSNKNAVRTARFVRNHTGHRGEQ
jgi:hypothetical protein